MSSHIRRLIPFILVSVAVLAVYGGLLFASGVEFVFDDVRFVSENEAIRDLGNAVTFFTDPTTVDPGHWRGIYRPVRTLDFAVDLAWFGASPVGFHLRSILYHVIGALFVLLLLRQWGAGEPAATLGALVFALHPVQVEAVAWITSRGDLLCLVFFLLALLLHGRGTKRAFAGAVLALILALFSKEAAVMFPVAAFLADFFFRDERRLRTTLRRWPRYAVYGLVASAYSALWLHLHHAHAGEVWHLPEWWGGSFAGTLLTMSRGFVYYARLLLLPVDMANDYYLLPVSSPDPLTIGCAVIVVVVLVVAIVRAFGKGGVLSFAVLWFFVTMFPTSNLPGPIGIPTAERFLYLPMAGLALPAGLLLARVWRISFPGRFAVIALLACLGAVSAGRSLVWTTEDVLWEETVRRVDSPRALERKAHALRESGMAAEEPAESRRLFLAALAMHERQFALWARLPVPEDQVYISRCGRLLVLVELGRFESARYEEARRSAVEILRERPGLPDAHAVVASALLGMGRRHEARLRMDLVLAESGDARILTVAGRFFVRLAEAYLRDDNESLARTYFRRALDILGPDALPAAKQALDRLDSEYEARHGDLERTRARDPYDRAVLFRLAELHARYGRHRDAWHTYQELLRNLTPPRTPEVLFSFARRYWEMKDTADGYRAAGELYREIRRDSPEWEPNRVEERRKLCEERFRSLASGGD